MGKTQHLAVRTAVSTSTDANGTAAQWLPRVASRDARSAELPRTSDGLGFGMCAPGSWRDRWTGGEGWESSRDPAQCSWKNRQVKPRKSPWTESSSLLRLQPPRRPFCNIMNTSSADPPKMQKHWFLSHEIHCGAVLLTPVRRASAAS